MDGLLLALLFATVAFAIVAAFARAAGRRFNPPATPSAAAAFAAAAAALLVAYRIVQQPGLDEGTTVKAGAWLSLVVLAVVALASSRALDLEEEGRAFRPPSRPSRARPRPLECHRARGRALRRVRGMRQACGRRGGAPALRPRVVERG